MFISKDSFNPTLIQSEPLDVTDEQWGYIKRVLDTSCSDSRFADKAMVAIRLILTKGITPSPSITSLEPSTIAIGDESVTLHVKGENFGPNPTIVFNGFDEPTTIVEEGDITTVINMDVWQSAAVVPVTVRSIDGITSEPMEFEFTQSTPESEAVKSAKERMRESLKSTIKNEDQGFNPNPQTPQNVTNETPDGGSPVPVSEK